jgi:hypothetical protein
MRIVFGRPGDDPMDTCNVDYKVLGVAVEYSAQ